MDKNVIVNDLITNKAFGEADRAGLLALSETALSSIVANSIEEDDAEVSNLTAEEYLQAAPEHLREELADMLDPNGVPEPVANQQKPATVQEFLNSAPPEFRDVLQTGLQAHEAQKTSLITTITANSANTFTADYLKTKPLQELAALARLASVNTPAAPAMYNNYAGAAGTPVTNAHKEEALALPTMKW